MKVERLERVVRCAATPKSHSMILPSCVSKTLAAAGGREGQDVDKKHASFSLQLRDVWQGPACFLRAYSRISMLTFDVSVDDALLVEVCQCYQHLAYDNDTQTLFDRSGFHLSAKDDAARRWEVLECQRSDVCPPACTSRLKRGTCYCACARVLTSVLILPPLARSMAIQSSCPFTQHPWYRVML